MFLKSLSLDPKQFALVTLHRASNTDDPKCFTKILSALKRIAQKIPLVFPVHPRTKPLLLSAFVVFLKPQDF